MEKTFKWHHRRFKDNEYSKCFKGTLYNQMRNNFGQWINDKAKKDNKIILLVGDIGFGIFDEFQKNFPRQIY